MLEGPQPFAGRETEVGVEEHPAVVVDLECFCLASAPVQREHERRTEPFVVGMLCDQRLQLGDCADRDP